jgi:hypothetical protein
MCFWCRSICDAISHLLAPSQISLIDAKVDASLGVDRLGRLAQRANHGLFVSLTAADALFASCICICFLLVQCGLYLARIRAAAALTLTIGTFQNRPSRTATPTTINHAICYCCKFHACPFVGVVALVASSAVHACRSLSDSLYSTFDGSIPHPLQPLAQFQYRRLA